MQEDVHANLHAGRLHNAANVRLVTELWNLREEVPVAMDQQVVVRGGQRMHVARRHGALHAQLQNAPDAVIVQRGQHVRVFIIEQHVPPSMQLVQQHALPQ